MYANTKNTSWGNPGPGLMTIIRLSDWSATVRTDHCPGSAIQ